MSIEITMPALGPNVEAGNLARWLVREGEKVEPGDVIAEIETDKATMEVEASSSGVLARLLVADGAEQVKVGDVIALLAEEGEELNAVADRGHMINRQSDSARPSPPKPLPASGAQPALGSGPAQLPLSPAKRTDNRRIKASPLARRLARARGIDLSTIQGSGPSGRIVKVDLDGIAPKSPALTVPAASIESVSTYPPPEIPHETLKLSNLRKIIARRLTESKTTVPHFYLTVDVRLDPLLKLRADLNATLGTKLSVNDMLIKALGLALMQVRDANVQFAGDQLYKFHRADIAVAVAIPGGLVTPVIKDAGSKHVAAIAAEMRDLVARAREGKLAPHEYQGGTASLSNLGMYGIRQFDAVINPPQALIVAAGTGEKRAIVDGDAIKIATVMSATGSFDHRAVDGAIGAEFMAAFRRVIEQPLSLLA